MYIWFIYIIPSPTPKHFTCPIYPCTFSPLLINFTKLLSSFLPSQPLSSHLLIQLEPPLPLTGLLLLHFQPFSTVSSVFPFTQSLLFHRTSLPSLFCFSPSLSAFSPSIFFTLPSSLPFHPLSQIVLTISLTICPYYILLPHAFCFDSKPLSSPFTFDLTPPNSSI